jgi:hypothetical protein
MKSEYYIDRSKSVRKSVIIYQIKGSVHSPVVYLSKPKWIKDDDFNDLLDRMQILIKPKEDESNTRI